jgi:hypothetical protein
MGIGLVAQGVRGYRQGDGGSPDYAPRCAIAAECGQRVARSQRFRGPALLGGDRANRHGPRRLGAYRALGTDPAGELRWSVVREGPGRRA